MHANQHNKPRTVAKLVPYLDVQFGNLLGALNLHRDNTSENQSALSRKQAINNLVGSLHQAVSHARDFLLLGSESSADTTLIEQLARAVVISGNGAGFDQAVRNEIQRYREVADEIIRWECTEEIADSVRQDVIAGWKRSLGNHQHNLQLLGVTIEEVTPGSELIAGKYLVVRALKTVNEEMLNTIELVVTPGFSWQNNLGKSAHEPAHVWAFTKCAADELDRNGRQRLAGASLRINGEADEPVN